MGLATRHLKSCQERVCYKRLFKFQADGTEAQFRRGAASSLTIRDVNEPSLNVLVYVYQDPFLCSWSTGAASIDGHCARFVLQECRMSWVLSVVHSRRISQGVLLWSWSPLALRCLKAVSRQCEFFLQLLNIPSQLWTSPSFPFRVQHVVSQPGALPSAVKGINLCF